MGIPDVVRGKRPKEIGQRALGGLSGQADRNLPPAQGVSRGGVMKVLVEHNNKPCMPGREY